MPSNPSFNRRVLRRDLIGVMASGTAAFLAACSAEVANGETKVIQDPSLGTVYQWEKDDLLVLLNGLQKTYHPGDTIRFNLTLNNQSSVPVDLRIRVKLLGLGQQVVEQAEVTTLTVPSQDAVSGEHQLLIQRSETPGSYTLEVELPPWNAMGKTLGGGKLTAPISVQ